MKGIPGNGFSQKMFSALCDLGIPVAWIYLTATGHAKSIMDAIAPVRQLFLQEGIHDYSKQAQGAPFIDLAI